MGISDDPYWTEIIGLRVLKEPPMTETTDNLDLYRKHAQPPRDALKQISGGRLKGMTDISPQWRYEALTEMFGPVGVGWYYDVVELRRAEASTGEVALFATVCLRYRHDGEWSEPVYGIGGSMLVAKERDGLRMSDEAEKMAVTDALSVCCKMLGIGSDIYRGRWDGAKYADDQNGDPGRPKRQDAEAARKKTVVEVGEKWKALGLDNKGFTELMQEAGMDPVPAPGGLKSASKQTLDKVLEILTNEEKLRQGAKT